MNKKHDLTLSCETLTMVLVPTQEARMFWVWSDVGPVISSVLLRWRQDQGLCASQIISSLDSPDNSLLPSTKPPVRAQRDTSKEV